MTRVVVIGGGQNAEHEVSLASADGVTAALRGRGHDVVALTIDKDGTWRDQGRHPIALDGAVRVIGTTDVVVPMVHGPRGEDGTLAALCDLAGVPYVGSGLGAGALAMDKWATKLVAEAIGIATAPGCLLTTATAAAYSFSHAVVVKPVASGSSQGVSLVSTADAFPAALAAAFDYDDRVLIEDVIEGREIDIAVLGRPDGTRLVAPALEIVADGIFDFATKYGGTADFRVPTRLTDMQREGLEQAAIGMYDALGCAGVARIDFFWSGHQPVLNEVNTTPGFTQVSQVPRMFAAAGLTYAELLDLLIRDAITDRRNLSDYSRVDLPVHRA
jgi:D-alanine-D-alanine ligase